MRLFQYLIYFQNILENYTFYLPFCIFSFRYDPAILPPQKLPMPLSDMLLDPPVEFMNSSIYLCDMWLLSYNETKKLTSNYFTSYIRIIEYIVFLYVKIISSQ